MKTEILRVLRAYNYAVHDRGSEVGYKFVMSGNYENTDMHERLKLIDGVESVSVTYDGECRTLIFIM